MVRRRRATDVETENTWCHCLDLMEYINRKKREREGTKSEFKENLVMILITVLPMNFALAHTHIQYTQTSTQQINNIGANVLTTINVCPNAH